MDNGNGNGWTRAEKMVFYRLDSVDKQLAGLKADMHRMEQELKDKLEHHRDDISERLNRVSADLAQKIAEIERQASEQKVKVAVIAAGCSLFAASLATWLVNQILSVG